MEIASLGREVSYVDRKLLYESYGRVSDMDPKIDFIRVLIYRSPISASLLHHKANLL